MFKRHEQLLLDYSWFFDLFDILPRKCSWFHDRNKKHELILLRPKNHYRQALVPLLMTNKLASLHLLTKSRNTQQAHNFLAQR